MPPLASRRRPGRLWLYALAAVALGSCARCERCGEEAVSKEGPVRYLPRTAEAALIVPDLGVLGDRLTLLQSFKIATFAAQLQGLKDAKAFGDALARQAGVDLRSREALKKAGIDPGKGLGVAFLKDESALAVVGVSDPEAFAETVKRLAKDRLGAGVVNTKQVEGHTVTTFSRAGTRAELGYVLAGGFALLAPGPDAEALPRAAALKKEDSLAADPHLEEALAQLPKDRDLIVHAPAAHASAKKPGLMGLTASVRLTREALTVDALARWPETAKSLSVLEKKEGPDLVPLLPEDAVLVARFLVDPPALGPWWPTLTGPYLKEAFAAANLDVDREILGNLKAGAALSLSVAPSIPLGQGMPELDVRRTNPFRYVQLVAVAEARDPAKLPGLLLRMPEVAPHFGARIEPLEREGRTLYVTRYAQGEGVHFAEAGKGRVLLASPLSRLDQRLAALAGKEPPNGPPLLADPTLKQALGEGAVNVVVDLDQLREAVRALPPEAWGIGGFAIKASALRWLDATDDLRAITLDVRKAGPYARANVALRFRAR